MNISSPDFSLVPFSQLAWAISTQMHYLPINACPWMTITFISHINLVFFPCLNSHPWLNLELFFISYKLYIIVLKNQLYKCFPLLLSQFRILILYTWMMVITDLRCIAPTFLLSIKQGFQICLKSVRLSLSPRPLSSLTLERDYFLNCYIPRTQNILDTQYLLNE